jgi:hypothetical protein
VLNLPEISLFGAMAQWLVLLKIATHAYSPLLTTSHHTPLHTPFALLKPLTFMVLFLVLTSNPNAHLSI